MNLVCSIIIPVYNNAQTLNLALESLTNQQFEGDAEVIIIDDHSSDNSRQIITKNLDKVKNRFLVKLIFNPKNLGLAHCYNIGIEQSESDIVVLFHPDCIITGTESLARLLKCFEDPNVVAAHGCYVTPKYIWDSYPFWQKVLYSRWYDKLICKLDGKFDAIRKDALKKIGMFDASTFRTAGEDRDVEMKLRALGKIVKIDTLVLHLHLRGKDYKLHQLIRKECQLAEAYGALLRRWNGKTGSFIDMLGIFIRPIFLMTLLTIGIHFSQLTLFLAAILIGVAYTMRAFLQLDIRILVLPFVNILVFGLYTVFFVMGYISGRQRL